MDVSVECMYSKSYIRNNLQSESKGTGKLIIAAMSTSYAVFQVRPK